MMPVLMQVLLIMIRLLNRLESAQTLKEAGAPEINCVVVWFYTDRKEILQDKMFRVLPILFHQPFMTFHQLHLIMLKRQFKFVPDETSVNDCHGKLYR